MVSRIIILSIFLESLVFSCLAQGKIYTGAKIGGGGSFLPLNTIIHSAGSTVKVNGGTTITAGVLANYMISNRIGIESGLHATHYSYYHQDVSFWKNRVWKGSATLEIVNVQVPVLILYRYSVPSNPFRDITFAGGTSLDWLAYDYQLKAPSVWLKNIYGSLRLGKEKMKGGRWEYGFEFQYSMSRFSLIGTDDSQRQNKLNSRLSLFALNLYYFFYSRSIGRKQSSNSEG